MAKKPWAGRFRKGTHPLLEAFSASVAFDCRLAEYDLLGSIVHAEALYRAKLLTRAEALALKRGLAELLQELRDGRFRLDSKLEDIHMNVEQRLSKKLGPLGGKLHTGRSRNDQVALDMRLYFRDQTREAVSRLLALGRTLLDLAEKHQTAIMPGFTHTRHAQPVLFAHHLLAYVEMLLRDADRFRDLRKRLNLCPLGAGALAGTAYPLDREFVAKALGFDGVTRNSLDTVGDRDYLLEFAAAAAITMIHLSRLMEELIWWSTEEFGFIEIPEEFATGSSMMPNKKNPDACELVRGKTGRVVGSLMALLVVMKATPLSYNRDFQEDKEGMFDAADTLLDCLQITAALLSGIRVNAKRMRRAAEGGYILATDLADYLVKKGLPFRQAHELAGRIVRHCLERGLALPELTLAELRKFSPKFQKDVAQALNLEASLKARAVVGGTAPRRVRQEIQRLRRRLRP